MVVRVVIVDVIGVVGGHPPHLVQMKRHSTFSTVSKLGIPSGEKGVHVPPWGSHTTASPSRGATLGVLEVVVVGGPPNVPVDGCRELRLRDRKRHIPANIVVVDRRAGRRGRGIVLAKPVRESRYLVLTQRQRVTWLQLDGANWRWGRVVGGVRGSSQICSSCLLGTRRLGVASVSDLGDVGPVGELGAIVGRAVCAKLRGVGGIGDGVMAMSHTVLVSLAPKHAQHVHHNPHGYHHKDDGYDHCRDDDGESVFATFPRGYSHSGQCSQGVGGSTW